MAKNRKGPGGPKRTSRTLGATCTSFRPRKDAAPTTKPQTCGRPGPCTKVVVVDAIDPAARKVLMTRYACAACQGRMRLPDVDCVLDASTGRCYRLGDNDQPGTLIDTRPAITPSA